MAERYGLIIDHRYSDLYLERTPLTLELCKEYGKTGNMREFFTCQITGKPMIDLPFAYEPYWECKQANN